MIDRFIEMARAPGGLKYIRLTGQAKPVFEFVQLMAKSEPMETDAGWWAIRLHLSRN